MIVRSLYYNIALSYNIKMANLQYDPRPNFYLFRTCEHCGWECDLEEFEENLPSKCAECESDDLTLEREYT